MSYEFKTLGSVEALSEVPENANALVEVDGAIKRVPGGALGGSNNGGGGWDLILRIPESDDDPVEVMQGDVLTFMKDLASGKCPTVCLYYSESESLDEYPYITCETPYSIQA